jgi:hypothetical protein
VDSKFFKEEKECPGLDGGQTAMRFSNHIKAIIRVTFSIERIWIPTGGNRRDWFPRDPGAEDGIQVAQR